MSFVGNQKMFRAAMAEAPLYRPACLVRAARAGQSAWRRQRDLPRLLRRETVPANAAAIRILRAAEAEANCARLEKRPRYDLHRHVTLLIALLAELQLARRNADRPRTRPRRISGPGTSRPAPRA